MNSKYISVTIENFQQDTRLCTLSLTNKLSGILLFKIKDKREIKKNINLNDLRNQLINAEKTKILNMYSLSHYDSLKRSITIKYY